MTRQFDRDLTKAENEFKEIVGACYLFLKHNTNATDRQIALSLRKGVIDTIEDIKEKVKEK